MQPKGDSTHDAENTTKRDVSVSDLDSSTNYEVTVTFLNDNGSGPPKSITVRTTGKKSKK